MIRLVRRRMPGVAQLVCGVVAGVVRVMRYQSHGFYTRQSSDALRLATEQGTVYIQVACSLGCCLILFMGRYAVYRQ